MEVQYIGVLMPPTLHTLELLSIVSHCYREFNLVVKYLLMNSSMCINSRLCGYSKIGLKHVKVGSRMSLIFGGPRSSYNGGGLAFPDIGIFLFKSLECPTLNNY